MVKRSCLWVIFGIISIQLNAQTGSISGIINDSENKETLIGTTVQIENTTKGTTTDIDGKFTLTGIPAGTHTLVISYIGYQTLRKSGVVVENGKETKIDILLSPDDLVLDAVKVMGRANRSSETILMREQKEALIATQAIGARELSRKGIGNAQAAVVQVSGISKQEGVKNVFVRGLGDRYNTTLLNGFPIPSEDPEYKNIALEFFGTDVIQNIGVNKVFSGSDYSDVGGAVINITSKELTGDNALGLEVSGGVNTAAIGSSAFLHQEGSDYFGFADTRQPTEGRFNFANNLDPKTVSLPLNHSYGISGGKAFTIGANNNPLSFFVVGSYSMDYAYTEEAIRNTNTIGTVWQNQKGYKYSQVINQLVLGNVLYGISQKHHLQYNFMMIHANDQYVGEYSGYNGERYQDSPGYMGVMLRQQTNENLLFVNQLSSGWELAKRLKLDAGASYNTVKGSEPDRRENNFSRQEGDTYSLTKSNRQKRFFSTLTDDDINVKAGLTYQLNDRFSSERSALKIGYTGRFSDNQFEAVEYNFTAPNGTFSVEDVKLDDWYNESNLEAGKFRMSEGSPNTYRVKKYVHSAYAEASYQLSGKFTGNIGFRLDMVDMMVSYHIQTVSPGEKGIRQNFYLPGFNLKYDINEKNNIRLGAGQTYTLPQSKEISPYQYVNISFVSQGNPNIQPSDNYNVDLKWDYYISSNELFSLTGFYKYIRKPIGRVDEGNSAGMLTYNNISDRATVGGAELEVRKNIFNRFHTELEQMNRLSVGLNASYIYTDFKLDIRNTEIRNSSLEGASPFIVNADLSYNYTKREKNITATLVFNYFSNRIHTIGAGGFNDIMEEGVPSLDFSASCKFNKHVTLKVKASNIIDPSFRLTRKSLSGDKTVLNDFRKGQEISIGVSYEF